MQHVTATADEQHHRPVNHLERLAISTCIHQALHVVSTWLTVIVLQDVRALDLVMLTLNMTRPIREHVSCAPPQTAPG